MTSTLNVLKIENLSCNVSGTQILNDINVTFEVGETVGIIGPNGSGKTTLFNCISGFMPGISGHLYLKDKEIIKASPSTRARLGIGRVFQNFGIFRDMSILENMLIAFEGKRPILTTFFPWAKMNRVHKEQALELLGRVNLAHRASEKASSLSGGQMRLLEIVRLLASNAEVFLLDEPTAGVSPKMKDEVVGLIQSLIELNKTIIVIEHDINFIQRFCERIVVLDGGKVVLDDVPEKVRADPRLQEIYFGKA